MDRRSQAINEGNVFNFALTKGSYYSFENEVRLFHWIFEDSSGFEKTEDGERLRVSPESFPEFGIPIRVDVDTLIEKVYISPFAPQWFFDIVKSLFYAYNLRGLADKLSFSEMKEEKFF